MCLTLRSAGGYALLAPRRDALDRNAPDVAVRLQQGTDGANAVRLAELL